MNFTPESTQSSKMTTYISILRGINVSGHNLIKMKALREMYENMGFHNVTTYIQSGNVIFSSKEIEIKKLEQNITRQIEIVFGVDVLVIVMTIESLGQIIENNPFLNEPNKVWSFLHVTFLSSNPDKYDPKAITDKKQSEEEIFFSENAIYMYCPNGYGKTKLTNNFLETKLKVGTTTRNWKTTNELLKIATQIDQRQPENNGVI